MNAANHIELERTFIPTHRAVKMLERAIERAAEEPQFMCSGFDAHGDAIPVENLGPWDAIATFEQIVASNPNAVAILEAQGRGNLIPKYLADPLSDDAARYRDYQCQNCDHIQSRDETPYRCLICGHHYFKVIY